MTGSFVTSIIFHFLVIFLITFSAEFLRLNNTKKILETPVEIVEISKKTELKKAKVEPSRDYPKYTPPKVQKKPNPDEFIKKANKKENKPKARINKKEEKKIDRMSSILNSIDKLKRDEKLKRKDVEVEKKDNEPTGFGEKLTISEVDMIRRQFIPCWTIPSGIKDLKKFSIRVKLKLDEDGNVTRSKILKSKNSQNKSYKTLSESVMRAINHPACKKIKVPQKKYDIWKNITLNFDLTQLELD